VKVENLMGKKKLNFRVYEIFVECFIAHTDISHKFISNVKARQLLGMMFHITSCDQPAVINDLETLGLIRRANKALIEILEF
jgi:hypothetical protein